MSQQRQLPYSVILLILGFTFIIYLVSPTTLLNLFYGEFDPYLSADRKVVVYEKMIEALRNMDKYCKDRRFYCKRPETRHVDCRRVLRGDKAYLQSLTGINRIPLIENPFLNLTCSAIKNRIIPKSSQFKLLMLNGTAFARIVFADYEFIEKQVQASYHPQNFFCFAVDANSSAEFQKRMKALERCLPNVFVLPGRFTSNCSAPCLPDSSH
ncbi:Core-2/I-Branching enzyme [Caenorhabditis elegans]|uniref:Core-2/I-Branching enzyme n=1 Tax=Caenorhabditis elegans TaxID=6239 RepID=D9N148_CAEEL|nr:Core-2/I-Branching enzyme [Caenorhabditis elegans]CBO24093.1 Core-2/I-Branching enzyme [Caenorhabditis elegans]|eukprot:NP_001256705.1 Uncharacterized protein CELE_F26D2.3 [Caenorhabditis elegans]